MGKAARDKGGRGEREAAKLLKAFYRSARRGVGQTQSASNGSDVEGTPFWVEVKRSKQRPNVHAAMEQARKAAKEADDTRFLLTMTRKDGEGWLVGMEWDTFAMLLEAAIVLAEEADD